MPLIRKAKNEANLGIFAQLEGQWNAARGVGRQNVSSPLLVSSHHIREDCQTLVGCHNTGYGPGKVIYISKKVPLVVHLTGLAMVNSMSLLESERTDHIDILIDSCC
jgi:hypothetical protein